MTTTSTGASIASEAVPSSTPLPAYSREHSMDDSGAAPGVHGESSNSPVVEMSSANAQAADATAVAAADERPLDKHILLKRLPTAMSLASDSEDEPGMAEKLSSRNSAPCFEDLKLNTVSWPRNSSIDYMCFGCLVSLPPKSDLVITASPLTPSRSRIPALT